MYRTAKGKRRLNVIIPEKVFLQMENDCCEYGMTKSSIVCSALVDYYRSIRERSTTGRAAD